MCFSTSSKKYNCESKNRYLYIINCSKYHVLIKYKEIKKSVLHIIVLKKFK